MRKNRKHYRCAGLGHGGMGKLLIVGVVGMAAGAGAYYLYLASKAPKTAGLGLLDVRRD